MLCGSGVWGGCPEPVAPSHWLCEAHSAALDGVGRSLGLRGTPRCSHGDCQFSATSRGTFCWQHRDLEPDYEPNPSAVEGLLAEVVAALADGPLSRKKIAYALNTSADSGGLALALSVGVKRGELRAQSNGYFGLPAPRREPTKADRLTAEVVAALCAAEGPLSREALCASTGEPADSGTLSRVLRRLIADGQVVRPKTGWYAIALRASAA